ncbi:MAG TPA: polysaccharide biosynthesis tyrosine autokinase [Verrucomicrobiales bacterium]|nr:polysaccharide biosynthesis tyrosine autokinase [Verrucomicrobiales bacterium]
MKPPAETLQPSDIKRVTEVAPRPPQRAASREAATPPEPEAETRPARGRREEPEPEPEPAAEFGREISLRDLFYMVRERWMLGAAVGLLLGAAVGYYLLNQPKIYRAAAEFIVELEAANVAPVEAVVDSDLNRGWNIESELTNHDKRLSSVRFAQMVGDTFSANEKAAFIRPYRTPGAELNAEEQVELFDSLIQSVLAVQREAETQVFTLHCSHMDPAMAALAADRFAGTYGRFLLEEAKRSTDDAVVFLERQVEELGEKVRQSEQALQDYRLKHGFVSSNDATDTTSARLVSVSGQINKLDVDIANLEAQVARVQEMQNASEDLLGLASISNFGSIPVLVNDLDLNRQERAEWSARYLERHPKMVENDQKRISLEAQVRENVERAIGDILSRLSQARAERDRFLGQLANAEQNSLAEGSVAVQYNALSSQLDQDRSAHNALISRLNEARIAAQLDVTNVKVVNDAQVPTVPFQPDRRRAALSAMGLFGMSLLGIPLVLGFIDNRIKSVTDAQNFLGLDCLGVIPFSREKDSKKLALSVYDAQDDTLIEAFRSVYSSLEVNSTVAMPKVILICSAAPQEGKSFVSCNLATTFARHGGRILLFDGDFRRPSQHRLMGLKNDAGIIRWIESNQPPPRSINQLAQDKTLGLLKAGDLELYLLRSGGSLKSPTEMIHGERFEILMNALRPEFDLIIIDSPPVGLFPDALFLAPFADEAVFVVKHNEINRHKIKFAAHKLAETHVGMIGIILNQVPVHKRGGYYAYGYSDYGYGTYSDKDYQKYYRRDGDD